MQTVTLISTVHKKLGKCDSNELCNILEEIRPEVVFLEALESTYSDYEQNNYHNFGIYHNKLELAAIQKYEERFPIKYIPVLEQGLPDSFHTKYNKLDGFRELERLLFDHNCIAKEGGFNYLNSKECSVLNEKIREVERYLLNDNELEKLASEDINEYENTMIRNVYSYCRKNPFNTGVFMCGVAHRNSIINKIERFNNKEKINLNWKIYGT
jgi:hypothetical protein